MTDRKNESDATPSTSTNSGRSSRGSEDDGMSGLVSRMSGASWNMHTLHTDPYGFPDFEEESSNYEGKHHNQNLPKRTKYSYDPKAPPEDSTREGPDDRRRDGAAERRSHDEWRRALDERRKINYLRKYHHRHTHRPPSCDTDGRGRSADGDRDGNPEDDKAPHPALQHEESVDDDIDDLQYYLHLGRFNQSVRKQKEALLKYTKATNSSTGVEAMESSAEQTVGSGSSQPENGHPDFLARMQERMRKISRFQTRTNFEETSQDFPPNHPRVSSSGASLAFYLASRPSTSKTTTTTTNCTTSSEQPSQPSPFSIQGRRLTIPDVCNIDNYNILKRASIEEIKRFVESVAKQKTSASGGHGRLNKDDLTKLLFASLSRGRQDVATYLIQRWDADLDLSCNPYGFSLFMLVSGNDQQEVVRLLLQREADASSTDVYGINSVMYAAMGGNQVILDLLLEHRGLDLDLCDNRGDTALTWAARHCHLNTVETLMARGASLTVRNIWGRTARDIAVMNREVLEGRLTQGHWFLTDRDTERMRKDNEDVVRVLEAEETRRSQVLPLVEICRHQIHRGFIGSTRLSEKIEALPLPPIMQKYLKFDV